MSLCSFGQVLGRGLDGEMKRDCCETGLSVPLPYFQNTIIHLQPEAHRKSLITLLQQRTIPDSLIKAFTSYITLLLEEDIKYGRMWE